MLYKHCPLISWLLLCTTLPSQAQKLGTYNIDASGISVSGISAGSAMATQFHVANSKLVMGAGLIAGVPYMCARGQLWTALTVCMKSPAQLSAAALITQAQTYERVGKIDNLTHLQNSRVFIFHGTRDSVVVPRLGQLTEEFYRKFISTQGNILTDYSVNSEHGFPTENTGNPCERLVLGSDYLQKCNYHGAFKTLQHIYGNLQAPTTAKTSNLLQFDQQEFAKNGSSSPWPWPLPGMSSNDFDASGYVYVPTDCHASDGGQPCRLHVVFHGCQMGRDKISDRFVRGSGYNDVAEANRIVVLYPQIKANLLLGKNPNGCWDWWGYTNADYATKQASQIVAVQAMINRLSGRNLTPAAMA